MNSRPAEPLQRPPAPAPWTPPDRPARSPRARSATSSRTAVGRRDGAAAAHVHHEHTQLDRFDCVEQRVVDAARSAARTVAISCSSAPVRRAPPPTAPSRRGLRRRCSSPPEADPRSPAGFPERPRRRQLRRSVVRHQYGQRLRLPDDASPRRPGTRRRTPAGSAATPYSLFQRRVGAPEVLAAVQVGGVEAGDPVEPRPVPVAA